jgi:hypothetical protein
MPRSPRPSHRLAPLAFSGLTALALAACSPPPRPAQVFAIPAAAPPSARPERPSAREELAVLPIEDDHLFRAERATLRAWLADALAQRAPEYAIVPFAEVDAKLRPVSSKTGARCAFEDTPARRRAEDAGWLTTDLMHVTGPAPSPEELWVTIGGADHRDDATFTALWDPRLERSARYRAAFASLQRQLGGGGLLGGLGVSGSSADAARKGPIELCESRPFGACEPESKAWSDRMGDLASCYAGEDDARSEVLLALESGNMRCELTDVEDLTGRDGKREACLCGVLSTSAAVRVKPGRRVLDIHYEAEDLGGKPRPEARTVEVTTNLHADDDWHSMRHEENGKSVYASVHRLAVGNLDGLAAPAARCAVPAGAVVLADLAISENGAVKAARVVTGTVSKETTECIEKALGRGAFECTNDGKDARLRVALAWPEAKR